MCLLSKVLSVGFFTSLSFYSLASEHVTIQKAKELFPACFNEQIISSDKLSMECGPSLSSQVFVRTISGVLTEVTVSMNPPYESSTEAFWVNLGAVLVALRLSSSEMEQIKEYFFKDAFSLFEGEIHSVGSVQIVRPTLRSSLSKNSYDFKVIKKTE